MGKLQVMCNASPVIGLLSIRKLFFLWELFEEIILPEAVYRELCADSLHHEAEIEEINQCVKSGRFQIYQVKNADIVKRMYGKLHFGELEVIVGAKELNIPLAVIDELAARKMAIGFQKSYISRFFSIMGNRLEWNIEKFTPVLRPIYAQMPKTYVKQ